MTIFILRWTISIRLCCLNFVVFTKKWRYLKNQQKAKTRVMCSLRPVNNQCGWTCSYMFWPLKRLFRIQGLLPVCLLLPEEINIKSEVHGKCYVFPLKTQFTKNTMLRNDSRANWKVAGSIPWAWRSVLVFLICTWPQIRLRSHDV